MLKVQKRSLSWLTTTPLAVGWKIFGPSISLADEIEDKGTNTPSASQTFVSLMPKLTRPEPLYPGHVPLMAHERALLMAGSAVGAVFHPENNNHIVTIGETTAFEFFLKNLRSKMLHDPTGRRILRERPYITSESLEMVKLGAMPAGSFGRVYHDWCKTNGVSPDTRVDVKFIDDEELAFVFQRYRQGHDFVHALTGLPIWREGEIAVKWIEYLNMGVPFAGMGALVSPWTVKKPDERHRLFDVYYPWGLECASEMESKKKCFINVMWEEVLERDVAELREELGVSVPPDMRQLRKKQRQKQKQNQL